MKVTDSYCHMLPEEVQMNIWKYKVSQEYQDELRAKQQRRLCRDIEQYGELKNKWGLGGIKIELIRCNRNCYKVWGAYINECWKQRYLYLGDTLEEALRRCNHVKSLVLFFRINVLLGRFTT